MGVAVASTAPREPSWVAAGGCGEDGQLDLFLLGVRLAGSIAMETGSIPGRG